VFADRDPELWQHYQELADGRLTVLAGDLGRERLGLEPKDWDRLAEDVDLILHPGAQVNHVLPYEQLFGPNVLGTAEVIRLAISGRLKPVAYLSSVGVAAGLDPGLLDEASDIRAVNPVRALSDAYASGYSTSKWAGEVLLREAHDACGLPVTVFRSDMILAHSRYAGQLNVPDMFTRLLLSIITTGIAPASFYREDEQGIGRRAHYDGLPVDFLAEAVDTLGARNFAEYLTYNMVNPHDDGISLDTFVDWLTAAGLPIRRIGDYKDWFTRFATALRSLPEAQRHDSALPVLHAYQSPDEPVGGSIIPNPRFQDDVREARVGGDGQIPHLAVELIAKYVSDLRQLGVLTADSPEGVG
jgi:fatty acid CoA ligase FadD9